MGLCFSPGLCAHAAWVRSPIGLVEVTAADRAAAAVRRVRLSSVMHVNAHDSSFCGGCQGKSRLRTRPKGFPIALWKPSASPYKLVSFPTLAGRGGSVSRRDLNQATGNRTRPSGETNSAEATNSNARRSSGGSAREGLLSEKPPPSHPLVRSPVSSGGGPGEALLFREAPPPESSLTRYLRP